MARREYRGQGLHLVVVSCSEAYVGKVAGTPCSGGVGELVEGGAGEVVLLALWGRGGGGGGECVGEVEQWEAEAVVEAWWSHVTMEVTCHLQV